MPSRIVGWGGTLTIETLAIPIRNLTITRQSSEVDVTAHGDTKLFSIPGRVKRGGTFEAYVGNNHGTIVNAMETINLANPLSMAWNGEPSLSMEIAITGCDFAYAADDASVYTVTFVETAVIS
jgi:hypothetical protein